MIAALAELNDTAREALWSGFLVFLRVGAAITFLPDFGPQSIPQRVRLALAIVFSAVVLPAVSDQIPSMADGNATLRPLATETIAGLAIGFGLRAQVMALQIAGTIAAQATSLSQLLGGAGAEPQPAMSQILLVSGVALAVASGMHVKFAELLIGSYAVMPLGVFPDPSDLGRWGLGHIAQAFGLAFMLAAPFVIASLLYNVALGVINKAMPLLMVAMVGAPALTLGGLAMLVVVVPVALSVWHSALQGFLVAPFRGVP